MKKLHLFLVLFAAAFFVRALIFSGYLSQENRYWQVDSQTYLSLAKQLTLHDEFSSPDGRPDAYRVPGYPLFLSVIFKIFGVNHSIALWIQIFLSSFIPFLVYLLALVLFPRRRFVALSAASITILHIGYVSYSGFLMSESLFIIFFLLFLIPFFRAVFRDGLHSELENSNVSQDAKVKDFYNRLALNPAAKGTAFVHFYDEMFDCDVAYSSCTRKSDDTEGIEVFFAGVMLGLASLIRPVGHYLLVVALVVLFFSGRLRSIRFAECLVLAAGWFLVVGGWLIRNAFLFGHIFFHTLPGGHFLYLSAARVVAHEQAISYGEARHYLRSIIEKREKEAVEAKGRLLDKYEVCILHENLAKEVFKASPLQSIKCWIKDIVRASLSLYSAEFLYLESGRKQIQYFEPGRSVKEWFIRYLKPNTEKVWLKILIWIEILFHFLLLLGSLLFTVKAFIGTSARTVKVFLVGSPFILLFLVIALSGGYARMRLPIEFLMIIFACAAIKFGCFDGESASK